MWKIVVLSGLVLIFFDLAVDFLRMVEVPILPSFFFIVG